METDGIHPGDARKEDKVSDKALAPIESRIRYACADCGHAYWIEREQRSSSCSACGNVAFHAESKLPGTRALAALSEEIVARRVLPRLGARETTDPLAAVRATPPAEDVERIRTQYQVEWQLWAALTRNFLDPAHHMAYITSATASRGLDRASERYREHRSVMVLLEDSRWQAEVADLMLARIESLALALLPSARVDYTFGLSDYLRMLPLDSRVTKVMWVALGIFLAARLLHLG